MDRNFALLGLREDASKEQVKAAYERRLSKYRAADYADDPEYVRRKTAELTQAYKEAYRKAGDGGQRQEPAKLPPLSQKRHVSVSEREEEKRAAESRRKKHREYEKKLRDIDEEERHPLDRLRMERKEPEEKKPFEGFSKPDLSVLKNKAQELRQQISENMKDDEDSFEDAEEQVSAFEETEDKKGQAEARLDTAGNTVTRQPKENSMDGKSITSIIGAVVTIVIALISLGIGGADESYDSWEETPYYYEEDYSEDDAKVLEQGRQITALFESGELEYDENWEYAETDEAKLEKAANRFAKRYTGYETMGELSDSLYERVGSFSARSDNSLDYQVGEVLYYYEFPSMDWACGYINPYTGETMTELTGYLKYLNRYWKENFD